MSFDGPLKRLISFALPVAAGVVLLTLVVKNRSTPEQAPPGERAHVVRVLEIKPAHFRPRAIGYGVAEPARTWNAVAQVAGQVEFAHPDLRSGAILDSGLEILRISPSDYEIAVRQAEANLEATRARLAEMEVQDKNSKASLEIEKRSLEINREDLARKRGLAGRGAVSKASVDDAERALLTQQARVQDLENSLRLFPTQIEAQRRQIEANDTALDTARLNLGRTRIKLPFQSRIANVNVEQTQFVAVGTTLASADDISAAEIVAQFPQSQFRKYVSMALPENFVMRKMPRGSANELIRKLGWSAVVRLRFDDRDITWPAKILRTSDTVDPKTHTIGVIVSVEKPYEGVRPGIRPPLVKGMFV